MNLFSLNAAYFEYSLLKVLNHENLLLISGYYEDNDYLIIMTELMSSDLRALIVEFNSPLSEQ